MHVQYMPSCTLAIIQPLPTERGRKHRKVKLHASLTASTSSTVAEEIVVLVRRLHPLRAWNSLINKYIGKHLREIPHLIAMMPGNHQSPHSKGKAAVNVHDTMFGQWCIFQRGLGQNIRTLGVLTTVHVSIDH